MYKRDIYLDIDDKMNNYIKSVELDSNSRIWHFHLTVDYQPLNLTGKTVKFMAEKPDKTNVLNDCEIIDAENGIVKVELTRQVNAVPGHVNCLLKIVGSDGYVLKTKTFIVEVSKTLSDKPIVSTNEFSALDEALGRVQNIDQRFAETNAQLSETKQELSSQLDNKVSYPILDNEVGVLNINYEYGNVKRYGAIGESSIEDNTASFQNAIDSAYACGFNVYVPMGIYNILSTLYLPSRISIKGEITTKYVYDYVYNPNDFRGSIIISKCDYLFKPKNVNSNNIQDTQLIMKEIMFLNRTVGSYDKTVLFKNMNLKSSNLENVCTLDYSIVLMGWLSGVSTIKNCNFQGINYYFIYSLKEAPNDLIDDLMLSDNACLVDSYILDSYINGKANTTGAILFKGQGIAHSTISNNFIDYAKEVFRFTASNKTSIISNNTFDVCYRIFKGKINSLNIYGNSFNNCRYNSSYWKYLTDEEMINSEWGVLEPRAGFTDTNITNNSAYQSDFLFKFDSQFSIYNITFNNNMLHCYLSEDPFQYKAVKGKGELDQTNIFLGDLMYKEYSTLPNPSLAITGGVYRITSFNGHIIRYKNRMLYNNNGMWCNMDGSEFIDS